MGNLLKAEKASKEMESAEEFNCLARRSAEVYYWLAEAFYKCEITMHEYYKHMDKIDRLMIKKMKELENEHAVRLNKAGG